MRDRFIEMANRLKDQIQNKLGLKPAALRSSLLAFLLKDQIQNKLGLKQFGNIRSVKNATA